MNNQAREYFHLNNEMQYCEATSNPSKNLERIYRAMLTIKATSVESERAF